MNEHDAPDDHRRSPGDGTHPRQRGPLGGEPMVGRRRRPARLARIAGYLFTAVLMGVVWFAANVWPGWEAVPFLSDEVPLVLGLVNLSLLATAVVNLVYVAADPPWLTAAGELVLSVISLAVAWQVAAVFPVDFTGLGYDLTTLARIAVVLALVGSAIAVLVNLVNLGREVSRVA